MMIEDTELTKAIKEYLEANPEAKTDPVFRKMVVEACKAESKAIKAEEKAGTGVLEFIGPVKNGDAEWAYKHGKKVVVVLPESVPAIRDLAGEKENFRQRVFCEGKAYLYIVQAK